MSQLEMLREMREESELDPIVPLGFRYDRWPQRPLKGTSIVE
jgi:hypothetical protein